MEKNKIISYAGILTLIILIILKFIKMVFPNQFKNTPFISNILGILFSILGFYVIVAVHEQQDDFISDKKYKFFKKIFGESGVKMFYYLLGAGFIFLGMIMVI